MNGNPQGSTLPFSLRGVSLKINGLAAVWEGCRGGSFDSAQTPFGIKRQKRRGGQSLVFEKQASAEAKAGRDRRQGLARLICAIAQVQMKRKHALGGER